ncbi:hypothetical protein [Acetobacterium wieringae]|uniref:hypothetical protein n=1 Tax=Acetobacterium wieringae TaxID=52694 RepID=UPI0026F00A0A|nr:hypothetical protein [Acetobacterium wieringae]
MEERIKNLHEFNFFYTMSEVHKMRTAKDVLCLINVLNKQHIKAHFHDRPDAIEVINSWYNDIISN